jgi:hypothetical protein
MDTKYAARQLYSAVQSMERVAEKIQSRLQLTFIHYLGDLSASALPDDLQQELIDIKALMVGNHALSLNDYEATVVQQRILALYQHVEKRVIYKR